MSITCAIKVREIAVWSSKYANFEQEKMAIKIGRNNSRNYNVCWNLVPFIDCIFIE